MAAFNWIIFEDQCPACGTATVIKAQCHLASSFESNENGRFCNKSYRLKEEMDWWPQSDPRWEKWHEGVDILTVNNNSVQECCYANCVNCGADLFAIIQFQPIKPTSVIEIGLENQWPINFKK